MKRKLLMAIVGMCVLSFYACKERTQKIAEESEINFTDEHTSQNSLDWSGTYSGTLKGLGGETFLVDLSLELDGMYAIELKQEGKNDIVKRNKFNWSKDGQVIELYDANEILNKFFVGENVLIQLNKNGERPQAEEINSFQLNKNNHEVEN